MAPRRLALLILLTAVYVGAAKLGLTMASLNGNVTIVWPPTGIALAALVLGGLRLWPAVAVGAFLAALSTGPAAFALATAAGNTLEAVLGAALLRRLDFRADLGRLRDVLALIACGVLACTTVSATVGVTALGLLGMAPGDRLLEAGLTWWLGDALGALIVAPPILVWLTRRPSLSSVRERLEFAGFLLVLGAVSVAVYGGWLSRAVAPHLAYVVLFLVIAGAIRFAQHGAVTGVLLSVGLAAWGTVRHLGPLANESVHRDLMVLADFAGPVAIGALILGAAIAEHRRTEDELREEADFRLQVMRALGQGVTVTDEHGRFAFVNPAYARMVGRTESEILGRTPWEFTHRDDHAALREAREHRVHGEAGSYEQRLVRPDGAVVNALVTGVPWWRGGRLAGAIAVITDLTERVAADRALLESERSYRRLVESATDAVLCLDDGGRITLFNPAAERIFGYPAAEVTGHEVALLAPPAAEGGEPDLAALLTSGDPGLGGRTVEVSARRRGGEVFPVEVSVSISERRGRRSLTAVIRDVGARRQAEQEIRTLYRAVEQSPVSVVVTDAQGNIEYVNPFFCKVTGYSRSEVLGKTPRVLKSGEHPPDHYRSLWSTITSGRQWRGEFSNRRRDGSLFWEEAVISPVHDTEGRIGHFIAVKRDITTEKVQQEALEQAQAQVVQAQRTEAIARLAGGIAHDFNNLLTIVMGRGELLLGDLPFQDRRRAAAQEILKAADRAAGLTRQLLAYSRKQLLAPTVLDLNAVLTDLSRMLVRLIGEDIRLTMQLAPDLRRALVDRGQIEQVVMNLVVNARDAMPHGGRLTLATSNEEIGQNDGRRRSVMPAGTYVRLAVIDSGVGMSEKVIEHIFEPFFTTKDAGKGTGLGLSVVYGIVKQSGGYVFAESSLGRGTAITIFLPPGEDKEAEACPPGLEQASHGSGACILLVEDDPAVRDLAREVLEGAGHRVLEAPDGHGALHIAHAHAGEIDLLLTDVVMPGLSGPELAARVEELQPGVKVLFTSGYTADAMGVHGVLEAGLAFLPKPVRPAALLAKVAEVLAPPARR
jgi:PAS domain S-box-containing protein